MLPTPWQVHALSANLLSSCCWTFLLSCNCCALWPFFLLGSWYALQAFFLHGSPRVMLALFALWQLFCPSAATVPSNPFCSLAATAYFKYFLFSSSRCSILGALSTLWRLLHPLASNANLGLKLSFYGSSDTSMGYRLLASNVPLTALEVKWPSSWMHCSTGSDRNEPLQRCWKWC